MDRLKCIAVFVQVVEAGSFAAVADPFGMTAAMIGRHVRALEDVLGTQLLNCTTRRHSLTEAGLIYYERSKVILAEVEAADESVAMMRSVRFPWSILRSATHLCPQLLGSETSHQPDVAAVSLLRQATRS